ncbi:12118_t:CDS:10 [Ambispora gerdemannii]|uniref:valine--tRNA ligase n=1 Tax=Ambispora gerdemannii TaxID=144530 RepID=A0A9N9BIW2_9GLOM|nr:12118_t:CDS:10 [Ambispora gerdemannii]
MFNVEEDTHTILQKELDTLTREAEWLLNSQIPNVVLDLKRGLKKCEELLSFQEHGRQKLELQIKLQNYNRGNSLKVSINPLKPFFVEQIGDTQNYIKIALDALDSILEPFTKISAIEMLETALKYITNSRNALIDISEGKNFPYKICDAQMFDSSLPEGIAIDFHVKGSEIVTSVYAFQFQAGATTTPTTTKLVQLGGILGTHKQPHKLCKYKDKLTTILDEITVRSLDPRLEEVMESLQKIERKVSFLTPNRVISSRTFASKPIRDLSKQYEPNIIEQGWYNWWETKGFFEKSNVPNSDVSDNFVMLTPPPNVTGNLHIGHALTFSIQDAIVRWRRMSGYPTSWIPGIDHAGIGTQSVVEQKLFKENKLTRHDLGREAFIEQVWTWRKTHGDRIFEQLKRLGASLHWKGLFFTMDEPRSKAVTNAFIRLFEDGMVYRDTRFVNWCCALETVISDIEVDYQTIDKRTFLKLPRRDKGVEVGVLHKFAYPIVDNSGNYQELIVATTRIETILGDSAVAVHPEDPRYQSLHGKEIIHPFSKKRLPIVCDSILVDKEFGTGAVKITPGHDPNDYKCARRHNLPIINILNKNGTFNENCGVSEFINRDRFEVREQIINRLSELGLYRGKNNHSMRVALCSRTGDIIEPLLQPQWYIRCKEMADKALRAAEQGDIVFKPGYHVEEWNRWLENIQDWCISRQLWWGHSIPVYHITFSSDIKNIVGNDIWIAASSKADAEKRIKNYMRQNNIPLDTQYSSKQDEDVLDTWFSSALLPLSALNWTGDNIIPDNYPTSMIETGFDILFFWVARMTILCTYFTGKPPFNVILLHAMVRDSQGRKMSKSLGNVIDPLNVIDGITLEKMQKALYVNNLATHEIERSAALLSKEYPNGIEANGADALRFTLVSSTHQTRQINLDLSNIAANRSFCNKIWNLFKFSLQQFELLNHKTSVESIAAFDVSDNMLSLVDRYILSRLAYTVSRCERGFNDHELYEATDAIRRFIWEDLCDVYLEFSKPVLYNNRMEVNEPRQKTTLRVLEICLDSSLRLLHPFMPFISEELWQHLCRILQIKSYPESIMLARYPKSKDYIILRDEKIEQDMQTVLQVIHASRSLRQNNHVVLGHKLPFVIWSDKDDLMSSQGPIYKYLDDISAFIGASSIAIIDGRDGNANESLLKNSAASSITPNLKIHLPMKAILEFWKISGGPTISVSKEEQIKKLMQKLEKINNDIESLNELQRKPEYVEKAPNVAKEKDK